MTTPEPEKTSWSGCGGLAFFLGLFGLYLALGLTVPVLAETVKDPIQQLNEFSQPEAAPAILSINLTDAAAEIFLLGAWKTGIGGYLGFNSNGESGAGVAFPGFIQQPWYNSVDFLASIWINRQFFFETHLSDGLKFSTFSLGYVNPAVPGLNKVQIANSGIELPAFSWLPIGGAIDKAPGLLSEWSTANSKHFAMIRLVNRTTVTQEFRGTTPIVSQRTRPDAFIRGQFFQLPYDRLSAIKVWIQTPDGSLANDGNRYALVATRDYLFIDPDRGRFGLKTPATGRVLASFTRGSGSVAQAVPALDAADGSISALDVVDFDSADLVARVLEPLKTKYHVGNGNTLAGSDGLILTMGSESAWLLFEPGKFSLFEDCSWYPKPQNMEPDGLSLDNGNDPSLVVASNDDQVHLAWTGAVGISERYPLLASKYSDRAFLYLPGYQAESGRFLSWRGPADKRGIIVLDNDPVTSTIVVLRNGQTCTGFIWDPEKHALLFTDPIADDDFLSITYDLKSGTGPRTIQFVQANRLDFLPWLGGSVGLAADWPLEDADSVDSQGAGIGRIMAGADLRVAPPESNLVVSSKITGRLDVPGANGATNLQSFDGQFLGFAPGISSLLPSYPATWLTSQSLDEFSRGQLLFRDFRGSNGDYLTYDNTTPTAAPIQHGQPTGPYLAKPAAGDPFSDQLAVLEFSLAAGEAWVAGELRLSQAQRAALEKSGSLAWWLKTEGITGDGIDVWLEAGLLAEDIDHNGAIASSKSGDYGLAFQDSSHGINLVAASTYQNSGTTLLSEDANANGLLDQEGLLVTAPTASYTTGSSGWSEYRLTLNRDDRIRLQQNTAIRLIIRKKTAGTTVSGRLLWGNIRIDLPGIQTKVDGGMQASAGTGSRLNVHAELAKAFPEAVLQSAPPAYAVLEWDGAMGSRARFSQTVNPVAFSQFGKFRLYLRSESAPVGGTSSAVLQLSDGAGSYATPEFDPGLLAANTWYRLELDFDTGRFKIDDNLANILAEGPCTITGSPLSIVTVELRVQGLFPTSGTILMDSLQLSQGNPHLSGSLGLSLDWTHNASLLEVGGFSIISMLRLHESLTLVSGTDLASHPGLAAPGSTRFAWEGVVGATIAGLDIEVGNNLDFADSNYGGTVSYRLAAPIGLNFPIGLKDSFIGSVGSADLRIGKGSSANLTVDIAGNADAAVNIAYNQDSLHQDWRGTLDLLPGQVFWWKIQAGVNQQSNPRIGVDFQAPNTLVEQLSQGYTWYLPLADGLTAKRELVIDDHFGLALSPVSVSFGQYLSSMDSASEQWRFSTKLEFTNKLSIGKSGTDGEFTLEYNRLSTIAENWHATDALSDLSHAWDSWGGLTQAWAVWPVWELFDPNPLFFTQSAQWPTASIKPLLKMKMERVLDPVWWTMLLPKQLDGGLGRQLKRTGSAQNDDFLVFGGAGWLLLNQFGRLGTNPLFSGYATDQMDLGVDAGALYRDQLAAAWQIQANLSIKLFGLAHLPGTDLGPPGTPSVRKPDGVLDALEPDQIGLNAAFYHREGLSPVSAFRAGLDFAWAIDVAGLQAGIFNFKPSSQAYLENIETLGFGSSTAAVSGSGLDNALQDLYGLLAEGEYPLHSGVSLIFHHKTYLVLPGLFYVEVFLGYGLDSNQTTGISLNAIQAGVEARIRF